MSVLTTSSADRAKVYGLVRRALDAGRLVRPSSCERCGEPNRPCSDGRSRLHAHHHDYAKPLDVEWICSACHRRETPLPAVMGAPSIGEKHGRAKLTDATVKLGRRLRSQGLSYGDISILLGVDKTTARRAITGIGWRHL